jgi:hypothetical protein
MQNNIEFTYRFITTMSGKRRAEVFDSNLNCWRVVGLRAAKSVIEKGLGKVWEESK